MLEPAAPGASYGVAVASEACSSVVHTGRAGASDARPATSCLGGGRAEQNPRQIARTCWARRRRSGPPALDLPFVYRLLS